MPINPVRDSPYSMREGTDILNTRHAAPVLRYVLRNDGCILQDLRNDVAGNCETILAVCARLTEAGLLTYEDVRSRPDTGKRSTRYSLTPKGRDVALLYEAMSSVIAEDGRIDPGLLDGFLEEAFRGRFRGRERSLRSGLETVRFRPVHLRECGARHRRSDYQNKHRILECCSLIMELKLEGIGAVPSAEIRIDGLTVILGESGTGKSTILKALYSVAEAIARFDDEKGRKVAQAVGDSSSRRQGMTEGDPGGDADADPISLLVERNLREEFRTLRQVRDLRSDGSAEIRLTSGNGIGRVTIGPDDDCRWDGPIPTSFSSVFYYDTPSILDEDSALRQGGHRADLIRALGRRPSGLADGPASGGDAGRFEDAVKEAAGVEFGMLESGTECVSAEGIRFDPSNLADGAKVFAVFGLLYRNGFLNPRTLLLLDGPEAHLHPKRQNILAELIVLLVRDMGVMVVMTTDSPQLLLAIQAFSMEYGQDVSYHFLERKGGVMGISDLDGDLSRVFSGMAEPYGEADRLYWDCIGRRMRRIRIRGPVVKAEEGSRASRPGKDIHWTAFWTCSKISSIPPTPGMTVRTPLSP